MARSRREVKADIRRIEARVDELEGIKRNAIRKRNFEIAKLENLLISIRRFSELKLNGQFKLKVENAVNETNGNITRVNRKADSIIEDSNERIRNNRDLEWYYIEYRNAED